MHLSNDGIQVDTETYSRTVGNIYDVSKPVRDANEVATLCGLSELSKLLLEQGNAQLNKTLSHISDTGRRLSGETERNVEGCDC
jgi:hypothetical protein